MPRPRKTVEQRRALVVHACRHRNKKEELTVTASGDDRTSSGLHSGDDNEEMDGEELVGSLQSQMEQLAMKKTSHDGLMQDISMQEWKRADITSPWDIMVSLLDQREDSRRLRGKLRRTGKEVKLC